MSIVAAVFGKNAIALGADSRCVGPDGQFRDTYKKAFRFAHLDAIGAYVGLMESGGTSFADRLRVLGADDIQTIDDLASRVALVLIEIFTAIPESEVSRAHRCTTVMLASRRNLVSGPRSLRIVTIKPASANEGFESTVGAENGGCWFCGDDPAQRAARKYIEDRSRPSSALRRTLVAERVREAVVAGILCAGADSRFPHLRSCGGEALVLTM